MAAEFTLIVRDFHGGRVDRDEIVDVIATKLGNIGYMADFVHANTSDLASAAESAAVAEEREACAALARAKADTFLVGAEETRRRGEARVLTHAAAALQIIAREIDARASGGNGGAGKEAND